MQRTRSSCSGRIMAGISARSSTGTSRRLWQRSTHIPLIFAGPGLRATGKNRQQPVNLLDLYPTLVEMCGLPAKSDLEGESLVPLLRDPKAKRKPTVITFGPGNHAVRSERWRYIRYSRRNGRTLRLL